MRVESQGFLRMTARFGEQRGVMIKGVVEVLEDFGESGVSQRKSRIQSDCVSVALFGRDEVVARSLWPHLKLTAPEIHDVGIRIVGQLRFYLRLLLRAELRLKLGGNCFGNIGLDRKDVIKGSIVALDPQMRVLFCVY